VSPNRAPGRAEPRTPAEALARQSRLTRIAAAVRARALAGRRHRCPCCGGGFRRFAAGPGGRAGAACPRCGSLERQRGLALFLNEWLATAAPADVLHFAPDGVIRRLLERPQTRYVGADLHPAPGDAQVDIQAQPFGDESFDLIVCSHVLEHVPDDGAAMREIRRVLCPAGVALLQHPIDFELAATVEDPSETDPAERRRRFGQDDHVRKYSSDIGDRLTAAGLAWKLRSTREMAAEDRDRFRLVEPWEPRASGSDVYVCRRA
jgi:SAM-dependent methyltransferase